MKQENIDNIYNWLAARVESAENFVMAELPPFIHEYLTWHFWSNGIDVAVWLIWSLIWAAGIVVGWKLGWKYWNKAEVSREERGNNCHTDPEVALYMVPWIVGGFMAIALIANNTVNSHIEEAKTMVQIKVAPKVFLLDKAAELIKEHKD